jgi:putative PIN family toxin of toxin-antitoxin system
VRVVFDTNIFISVFVIPGSQAEKAIVKIIESGDYLIISKEIIDEVLSVLSSKFSHDREALSRIAVYLSEVAELVCPTERIRIFKDEPDNRIIECALKGKSDVVVTGDKEMLKIKQFRGIRIISLKEYLEI